MSETRTPRDSKMMMPWHPYDDDYWRSPYSSYGRGSRGDRPRFRAELERIGYKPKKSLPARDLTKLLLHHSLEDVCYDRCRDTELARFAVNRGLVASNGKLSRVSITKKLMEDDMNSCFPHFLDLPPEIRSIVYEIYMSDFADGFLNRPKQPPLARACQLTRKEALPIFYSTCTLRFTFNCGGRTGPDYNSLPFLRALSVQSIGSLRKGILSFNLPRQPTTPWQERLIIQITIDTSTGGEGSAFEVKLPRGAEYAFMETDVKREVVQIMEDVGGRPGPSKFNREDFNHLLYAVELLL